MDELTPFRLRAAEASFTATVLLNLADLIDPVEDRHRPFALSDGQVQVMTDPAALAAVTSNRRAFGERLRDIAREIDAQLPDSAPRVRPLRGVPERRS